MILTYACQGHCEIGEVAPNLHVPYFFLVIILEKAKIKWEKEK